MQYLLDTCVISDFIKGEPGTKARLKETPPASIAVSAITVMELDYGLVLNLQRAEKVRPTIVSFLSSVTILPFTAAEAQQAAEIRATLKSQGQPIGAYHVLSTRAKLITYRTGKMPVLRANFYPNIFAYLLNCSDGTSTSLGDDYSKPTRIRGSTSPLK